LLLHRYNNIDYILQLDADTGCALISKAQEQERDNRFFLQWVVQLPLMGSDNFVSFADYKDKLTGANIDRRSAAEILAELNEVEKELQGGGDG
jgi:hypothetical protein